MLVYYVLKKHCVIKLRKGTVYCFTSKQVNLAELLWIPPLSSNRPVHSESEGNVQVKSEVNLSVCFILGKLRNQTSTKLQLCSQYPVIVARILNTDLHKALLPCRPGDGILNCGV